MLAEQGRRASGPSGRRRRTGTAATGWAARRPPGGRAPRSSPRATNCGCRAVRRGSYAGAAGTPARERAASTASSRSSVGAPRRRASRRARRARRAGRRGCASAGRRPGRTARGRRRAPATASSVATESASQRSGAGGRVHALRRGPRAAVAVALEQVAVGGPLDERLGRDADGGVEHRHLDEASRRRCGRAARARPARRRRRACPPLGSHGPRWMRGWSSAWPVIHASPAACSIVCANPGRSRHGPSSPKAGMRTSTARGLAAWTASQPSPNLSSTRGVKFSTTTSHWAIRSSASTRPSGRWRGRG